MQSCRPEELIGKKNCETRFGEVAIKKVIVVFDWISVDKSVG
jgi:hypothetical protein